MRDPESSSLRDRGANRASGDRVHDIRLGSWDFVRIAAMSSPASGRSSDGEIVAQPDFVRWRALDRGAEF
eukprot:1060202-Prymnesium_polylepis.1